MKRKYLGIIFSLLIIISMMAIPGCASDEPAPSPTATPTATPTPTPEPAWEWPEKLSVVSTSEAGQGYATAVAWTSAMEASTGVQMRIVAEARDRLKFQWLREGKFFTTANIPMLVLTGDGDEYIAKDGGPFQARNVFPIAESQMSFAVREDSDIDTIYDIKPGMKLVETTFSASVRAFTEAMLAWVEIDPDDMVWIPVSSPTAMTMAIVEGKADVCAGYSATSSWLEAEASPHGLLWLELNPADDPDGAARFLDLRGDVSFGPITSGVDTAIGRWGLISLLSYVTTADQDAELIYQTTKWLAENHESYDTTVWTKNMTVENLLRTAETDYVPLHAGAVKYLDEVGLWTSQHETRRQANIDQLTIWVDAYQAAIVAAEAKGLTVEVGNQEWLDFWRSEMAELPKFKKFSGLD
jgi:uncharacterized protein